MWLINVLSVLLILGALSYYRACYLLWSGVILVVGLFWMVTFGSFLWFLVIVGWGLFSVGPLRRKYLSKPCLLLIKKLMPPISQTERDALEAGDTWWDAELFSGQPCWKTLHNYPQPKLTAEEQSFLDNQVETLCAMLDDWKITQELKDLPQEVWDYLKQEKFFGMVIDKKFGGLGFSAYAHSCVIIKISSRSPSAGVTAMVPNSLGPGELLYHYGTKVQQDYYLPRLANGQEIPCFGLTGPEAGSDAAAMTDEGIVCYGEYKGEKVLGMRITWNKRYITLAPVATIVGLAIKVYDPENLLSKENNLSNSNSTKGERDGSDKNVSKDSEDSKAEIDSTELGITLCLLPADHPGVEIGKRHYPAHMAFMNGPTSGTDVFVPMDFVIGGQDQVGNGWRMLMECLSVGRAISLPSTASASSKLGFSTTSAYAQIRKQFNVKIAHFEGVEAEMAKLAGMSYTMEACRMMTLGGVDSGVNPAIVSAMMKYHMTEMARESVDITMDVQAGRLVQHGPRNYFSSAYDAIPVGITVEGANILTRNLIIFGQGLTRCHPYLLDEITLATSEGGIDGQRVKQFDRVITKHILFAASNVVRSLINGLLGSRGVKSPVNGELKKYYQRITRLTRVFALLADTSVAILGGNIKRKERLSARLGDILSHLYMASAVLKYYKDQGESSEDLDYVKWSLENQLYLAQIAAKEFLENFPQKAVAKVLRVIAFPYGFRYKKPSDSLSHDLMKVMLDPSSDLHKRLIKYCYFGKGDSDPTGRLHTALAKINEAAPFEKNLKSQLPRDASTRNYKDYVNKGIEGGIISHDQAEILLAAQEAYLDALAVDEFDAEYFK